jgi:SepF-like predicted cell division protein (DUF552 family)
MMKKINLIILLFCISSVHAAEPLLKNAYGLPYYVVKELRDIVRDAGESNVSIASNHITVKQQVELMLDYYKKCENFTGGDKNNNCGAKSARVHNYNRCNLAFNAYDIKKSDNENVQTMSKVLIDSLVSLGRERPCMRNVIVPQIYSSLITVYLNISSVKDKDKFYDVIKKNKNVVQFYHPDIAEIPTDTIANTTLHIGFKRL